MAKYKNKDVWDVIDDGELWSGSATLSHRQAEMAIQSKNAEIVSTAVKQFREATEESARKTTSLTIVVVVLTAVLVVVGAIEICLYFLE